MPCRHHGFERASPGFDYDFLDGVDANPSYCTQQNPAVPSLQDQNHQTQPDVGTTLIASGGSQNVNAYVVNTEEGTAIGGGVVKDIVEEVLEDVVQEVVEEVWLTPPVPYTGQTFSTKKEAREFYNSYAKRVGFFYPYKHYTPFVFDKGTEQSSVCQFQYWLLPNNIFVYGYGKRNYRVTTLEDEENYYCECSKFDRDGMLCCHIMKVMPRLGVKAIPQRYILKRWTQEAVPDNEGAATNAHVQADFIACVEGCASKEVYTIMDNHIRLMRSEVDEMKKKKKSSAQRGHRFPAFVPDDGPNVPIAVAGDTCDLSEPLGLNDLPANPNVPKNAGVDNPPRSKVKGRKKEKRLKRGMNAEAKRKNKCGICKLTGHNAARCPDKIGIEDGQSGSMAVN
ncbi:hypothetical protein C2845_PM14G09680 [Panicum miliaceum]|uniref:SWIM-type domain-containing protein n=1 Tax=Panicum miliaceum TaxID=4540 RepID=A0A3L6PQU0_PANMI|nr:hypothetical protein C2845_PM14G09680 [Panicum miliaceum]